MQITDFFREKRSLSYKTNRSPMFQEKAMEATAMMASMALMHNLLLITKQTYFFSAAIFLSISQNHIQIKHTALAMVGTMKRRNVSASNALWACTVREPS